jgi:hypothetical protein
MIPNFKDGLIGLNSHENSEFRPEDNEERYKESLKTQPIDWVYRTEKVLYKTNKYGHRSVEIDELQDDYFLFTGCSYTEGVGLPYEKTYPYLVSEHFNKTYYNLGIGGTGVDLVTLNLISFLSLIKKKPSKIIIQWPNFHRFFNFKSDFQMQLFLPSASANYLYKILTKEDIPYRQNIFYRQYVLQYLKNLGFNSIYELCQEQISDKSLNNSIIPMLRHVDLARDLSHPGIKTHQLWANLVINEIEKN